MGRKERGFERCNAPSPQAGAPTSPDPTCWSFLSREPTCLTCESERERVGQRTSAESAAVESKAREMSEACSAVDEVDL